MKHKFKYEIGHKFFVLDTEGNFHKATIREREHRTYKTRVSQDFYGLQIDDWNNGEQWRCSTNFIDTCAFTESEILKRLNQN